MYTRQGSRLLRQATRQGAATLRVHRLGAHPIVRHFLDRMNVGGILRGCVGGARQGPVDHAVAIEVLVHNLVLSPGPLYRVAEWVAPVEAAALGLSEAEKAAINDDRIARALDALASERGRSVFFRLALRIIKDFQHVTADGAVPLLHHVWSGNRTDDSVHRRNTDDLRRLLGRDDFIYVADGKLCTADNLKDIVAYGGKFVTVMPRTRREDVRFRQALHVQPARWRTLLKVPNRRREGEPPDIYSTCGGNAETDDGFRLIWIRSSQKARQDAQARLDELRKAEIEVGELVPNRRGLKTAGAIRQAIRAILRRHRCERFLKATLHRYTELKTRYLRRGRPRPGDPVRAIEHRRWRVKLQRDPDALRRESHTDGVFPLVTNLEREGKRAILLIYKYQPYIEKRFAHFKTELEIAPVYLKKPRRVAGLIHAYFIALALVSLIERQVRSAMHRRGIQSLPLLPEQRQTDAPTAPRILEAFSDVCWYEFERAGETVAFPINLSPLQLQLLDLLEVPRNAYQ
jgi:transposase